EQLGPQDAPLLWRRHLGKGRDIPPVGVKGDLWRALHIEVPARIARFPCVRGGHHVTGSVPHVEKLDGAWLSTLASCGGKLEESGGAVLVACVGAAAGEGMGEHGEIAHAHLLRSHSGNSPSHGAVPEERPPHGGSMPHRAASFTGHSRRSAT